MYFCRGKVGFASSYNSRFLRTVVKIAKMMQSLWRATWQFLIKLNKYLLYSSGYLSKRNVTSCRWNPRTGCEREMRLPMWKWLTQSRAWGRSLLHNIFKISFHAFGHVRKSTGFQQCRPVFMSWLYFSPVIFIHSTFLSAYQALFYTLGILYWMWLSKSLLLWGSRSGALGKMFKSSEL